MKAIELVNTHLKAQAAVTAIVGTRVYEDIGPAPVSKAHIITSLGTGRKIVGIEMENPIIRIRGCSQKNDERSDLADAIIEAVQDFKGVVSSTYCVFDYAQHIFYEDGPWYIATVEIKVKFLN